MGSGFTWMYVDGVACRADAAGRWGRLRDRLKEREWKHVPLWGIPVKLVYAPARVTCPECGKVCVEDIPWSYGKCPVSIGLIWLLSAWAKLLAWDVVAKLFGVHWNTVAGDTCGWSETRTCRTSWGRS